MENPKGMSLNNNEGDGVDEPEIIINGTRLTIGQAYTLRVAVSSFATELKNEGLGDDAHGVAMTAGYLARLNEIFKLMLKG